MVNKFWTLCVKHRVPNPHLWTTAQPYVIYDTRLKAVDAASGFAKINPGCIYTILEAVERITGVIQVEGELIK